MTANFSPCRDGARSGKIISIIAQAEYTCPMKSAFELAMSRLEKESPTQKLTDEQKAKLAEVDNEINAKIAERKLFLEDELRKAAGDPQAEIRAAQAALGGDCPPRGEAGAREGEDTLGGRSGIG